MQKSTKRRLPLFFEERTFEFQVYWDNERDTEGDVILRRTYMIIGVFLLEGEVHLFY